MFDRLQSPEFDLSTDELFSRVIDDLRLDDNTRLGALVALHARPTRKVVDRCVELCTSGDPYYRVVGLRVLRELRAPSTNPDVVWLPLEPMVLGLVADDQPEVVAWAVSCLGYQANSPDALAAVLGCADHPDPSIRFAVAAALPHMIDRAEPDHRAIATLMALGGDSDSDVRSYALMGLSDDLDSTPEIRRLLEAHLDDPDEQIRRHLRQALE
jgi:HEAT repeat protein